MIFGSKTSNLLLLLGTLTASACEGSSSGDEPVSGGTCPMLMECSGKRGDEAPERDPACNSELKDYRPENWSIPMGMIQEPFLEKVSDYAIEFGFGFGPDRGSDSTLTAWLNPGQDLQVEFTLAVGASFFPRLDGHGRAPGVRDEAGPGNGVRRDVASPDRRDAACLQPLVDPGRWDICGGTPRGVLAVA
jgi:hypothetical protein